MRLFGQSTLMKLGDQRRVLATGSDAIGWNPKPKPKPNASPHPHPHRSPLTAHLSPFTLTVLLYSAQGLPRAYVENMGDPYEEQVECTVEPTLTLTPP